MSFFQYVEKFRSQTQGCWLRSKNATSVLCIPHASSYGIGNRDHSFWFYTDNRSAVAHNHSCCSTQACSGGVMRRWPTAGSGTRTARRTARSKRTSTRTSLRTSREEKCGKWHFRWKSVLFFNEQAPCSITRLNHEWHFRWKSDYYGNELLPCGTTRYS